MPHNCSHEVAQAASSDLCTLKSVSKKMRFGDVKMQISCGLKTKPIGLIHPEPTLSSLGLRVMVRSHSSIELTFGEGARYFVSIVSS